MKLNRSNPLFARYSAIGLTSIVLCSGSAFAATYQWDQNDSTAGLGGIGAWDTTSLFWDLVGTGLDDGTAVTAAVANWNPTTAVDATTFGGTAGTVSLAASVNVLGTGFTTTGYTLDLTNIAATNYQLGALTGNATLNTTLGAGATTADFKATDWSGFTGILNVGVAQAAGAGKAAVSSSLLNGFNSAATVNITAHSTLYSAAQTTHAAALTLNGGDTGEAFGQLRLDNGGVWSGAVTLAGAMTGTDSHVASHGGTSFITGAIGESGTQILSKGGNQTLVLSGANTYSGGTTLRAGTLAVTSIGNVADTSSPLGAGGGIDIAANATLNYWGAGDTTDRVVTFSTGSGGNIANNGAGALTFSNNMIAANAAMGVTFTGGANLTIGSITGNAAILNFNKTGTGTLTVTGDITSSGTASNIRPQGGVLSFGSSATTTTNSTIISERSVGGILRVASGASIKTNADANTNGIMGGWAVFNNTDWAQVNGAGTAISAYAGYTNDTWASGNNTTVTTSSAPTSGSTTNSLRFNAAAANTITLAGINTLTSGGILVTSTVGANDTLITGGTLAGANTKDLVIHQFNTGGTLTIGSVIANNTGATALTVAGPGTTILTAANTYTGFTYVLDGAKLTVNANSGAKRYDVASTATLELGYGTGNSVYGYGVTVAGAGTAATTGLYLKGGLNYNFQSTLTLAGAPTTVRGYGTGNANLYGFDTNGTLLAVQSSASGSIINNRIDYQSGSYGYVMNIEQGLNTATGDVILEGILKGSTAYRKVGLGSVKITGAGTNTGSFDVRVGYLILSGGANRLGVGSTMNLGNGTASGKLILDGIAQTFTALTTAGSGTANAVVGGSATLSTLTLNNAAASALSATIGGKGTNENNLALVKSGAGTLTLTGTNTYTGGTIVNAGTLKLDYSTVDGSKLADSGTLDLAAGTLELAGGTRTEVVASTVISGTTQVNITRSSGSATISLGDITRTSTGTLNIAATGIVTTTLANDGFGKLPSWITLNGQIAANDGSGNIIAYVPSYTNVNRLGGSIASSAFSSIKIVDGGVAGDVVPAAAGLTEIDILWQAATAGPAVVALGASDTFRLGPLGLVSVPTGSGSLSIQGGILTAGGADDTNGVIAIDTTPDLTISSAIDQNGTGVVSLSKTGAGALLLTSSNLFSGGLILNQGELRINHAEAMGIDGTLTINGGSLDNTSGAAISIVDTIPQVWNADFTFGGSNDLTFSAGAVTLGANRIVTVNGGTLGIGGAVDGAFTLGKAGAGTLTIGSGSWSGETAVSGGTLEVLAKTNDVKYVVGSGATLKIGYSTAGGYANTNLKLTGDGVGATTGLYLLGGKTYNAAGSIELLTAPTTIRHYGSGLASLGVFDVNANGISGSAASSGSVIDANIQLVSRGYGMSVNIPAGANTATGDLVINGQLNVGSLGFYKRGTGSVALNAAATTSNTAVKIQGGTVITGIADALGANAELPISAAAKLVINGYSQAAGTLSGAGTVVNGSATAATLTINQIADATFSGVLGGVGTDDNNFALAKSGSFKLTLTGANTYSGSTSITAGTLSMSSPSLADAADVLITTGATLDLTTASTDTIDELIVDGTPESPGVYGATGSGAQFERSYITGSGTLTVTTGSANGYDSWSAQITNGETLRTQDADDDGFTNLQEFLFGTDPMVGNGTLVTTTSSAGTLVLRWLQRESAATYTLQQSATLSGWTTLVSPVPAMDGDQTGAPTDYDYYQVTLTVGAGKDFFRVQGVEN
jgi:fibronectin-binding autotransporter adhesin